MINEIIIFILLNFFVGFFSDIVLNDLSTNYGIIKSLQPYFYKQSIISCAIAAGLTIVIALLITMVISKMLFKYFYPNNFNSLIHFTVLAFGLGYIIDIIIEKTKIFGNRLDAFYREFGAGFWGATAFIFAILISYYIQTIILQLI